jgi:hypothetical protein
MIMIAIHPASSPNIFKIRTFKLESLSSNPPKQRESSGPYSSIGLLQEYSRINEDEGGKYANHDVLKEEGQELVENEVGLEDHEHQAFKDEVDQPPLGRAAHIDQAPENGHNAEHEGRQQLESGVDVLGERHWENDVPDLVYY